MCGPFKSHGELAKDNPKGLETLKAPQNFSSNPGFSPTGVATPPRSSASTTVGHPGGTAMTSVQGSPRGSGDAGMDGGPLVVTTGFGG